MRALLVLVLVAMPACTLYGGEMVDAALIDDVFVIPDAGVDAAFPIDCIDPLPCPIAPPGRVSLCGRVLDVETAASLQANAPGASCDAPSDIGACHLSVRFYNALDYTGDPSGAASLVPTTLTYDTCGRFAAGSLPRPSLGYVAIVTDDAPGTADDHRATMTAMPVTTGQVLARLFAHSLRRSTDAAWTAQAGLGASTFADRGAILAQYEAFDTPWPGVTITSNGSIRAADDYYFSDPGYLRSSVDPIRTATGTNGAALMLNSPLVEHSGTGGEPNGCVWTSYLAASIPGVLFVQAYQLEVAGFRRDVRTVIAPTRLADPEAEKLGFGAWPTRALVRPTWDFGHRPRGRSPRDPRG